MKSIIYQSPLSPLLPQQKYTHQIIRTVQPLAIFQQNRNVNKHSLVLSVRTRALPSLISIPTASPASTGDLSVLLPTSVLLLLAYWVANFVVPSIILKDLQSDKTKENVENQSEDQRGSKPIRKT